MVRVPTPSEPLRSPGLGGFTAGRVVPIQDRTGPQILAFGRAQEGLGSVLAAKGRLMQHDLDQARTKEAYTSLNDLIREVYRDPQGGYLTLTGKAAMGESRERAIRQIETQASALQSDLDNDVQKGMFGQAMSQRMVEVRAQADVHEAREARSYNIGQTEAKRITAVDETIDSVLHDNELTPDAFERHFREAVSEATQISQMLGESKEVRERRVLETTTQIHSGAVRGLLDEGEVLEADEYLTGVDEDELVPQERTRLRQSVRVASVKEQGGDLSFEVISQVDNSLREVLEPGQEPGPTPRATPAELLARGLSILDFQRNRETDPISDGVYEVARQRLEREVSTRRTLNASSEMEDLKLAERLLMANRDIGVTDLPVELYVRMFNANTLDEIIAFDKNNRQHTTDRATYNRIASMSLEETRQTFPDRVAMERLLRTVLNPRDVQGMLAQWDVAHEVATPDAQTIYNQNLRTRESMIKGNVISRTPPANRRAREEEEADEAKVREEIQRRVDEETVRTGKKPVGDDLQVIIDAVLLDTVVIPGGGRVPASTLTEAEAEVAFVNIEKVDRRGDPVLEQIRISSIIPEIRRFLEFKISDNDVQISEQNIVELWRVAGRPETLAEARRALRQ